MSNTDRTMHPLAVKLKYQKRTGDQVYGYLIIEFEFEILIKKEINNFRMVYAATPYNQDYIKSLSHGFDLMISPSLFWETLLVTLRGVIIRYSKNKKSATTKIKRKLETEIRELDTKVNQGKASINEMSHLVTLNTRVIDMRKEELKGAYVRLRAEWLELGEKPSRYFLNLENRNMVNKSISEIQKDDKTTIKNQKQIIQEVNIFYENLYT